MAKSSPGKIPMVDGSPVIPDADQLEQLAFETEEVAELLSYFGILQDLTLQQKAEARRLVENLDLLSSAGSAIKIHAEEGKRRLEELLGVETQ